MKNITPIVLSSLFLLSGISLLQATVLSNQTDSNHQSSNQIAQKIDPELQQLDEATKQASTTVNRIAKDITVRITSANNGGSGVLIAKKGNTYLVLTNAHVTRRATQFQIQAPDGQKYNAKTIDGGFDRKYDLALLEFTSSKQYQLANLGNPGILKPNDRNIYSAGFPFDSKDLRISPGAITQLSDIPFDNGTQIGYEIAKGEKGVRQGMSGGPIFDVSGVFLGINTIGVAPILPNYTYNDGSKPLAKLAAKYRTANWGVPVYNFLIQVKPDILYGYKFSGLEVGKIQRKATLTGYMAKLNDTARKQTVRIENSGGNGSGVIIAQEGNSYYVLTAKHVLEDRKTKQLATNNQIITYDQDSHSSISTIVAKGVDLAVIKFSSSNKYPLAQLSEHSPNNTSLVFVGGFPGREKINSPLWQWQLNPGFAFGQEQGKLSTQNNESFSNDGYDLIYSSISYGGMSGGPVFDTGGRVIGIHGLAETTRTNDMERIMLGKSLGISIQTFIRSIDALQVKPQLVKIVKTSPTVLNKSDINTVGTVMVNIPKPQEQDSGERWLAYGNQLDRTLQYDKSVVAFDKAIAKGQVLMGNYAKAVSLSFARKLDLAEISITKAIAVVPSNKRGDYYYFWKFKSFILRDLGKYDEALKAIDIAIGLEPSDSALYNEKAALLISKKQYAAAILIYNDLIRTKPEAYSHYGRGTAKSFLGDNRGAIDDYSLAIKLNPNFDSVYIGRGNSKLALGDKQGAIDDYNLAIKLNANSAHAYYNRGTTKMNSGDKRGAIDDFDLAIKLDVGYALAYHNRGNAKSDLGNKQGAIGDFDQALAINPEFALAYYNRGLAKSALGNHQGAIGDYDQALAINPKYAQAYGNRGNAKSALGNQQGAIGDYDQALAINPKFAEAYANRGIVRSQLGQKQAAMQDMSAAAELFRQQGQMDYYQRAMGMIAKLKGN
jgi:tetratricopeptide (TPR) repeat protein/S1-C subfamily serine protease